MSTTEALDPTDRLVAERACERLIIEFVHKLDLGDPGEVAELFAEDGVWEWAEGDRRIQGRDALRSYFAGRPADRLSRRICTNILVNLTSEATATATTYFTTYRVDGYTNGYVPPQIPTQVGHYEDTFLKLNGLWLLSSRSLFLAFAGPTENLKPTDKS
ncbi:nuclear transport factor 2 family protein [Streptomyces sp. NPDC127117]|uniref:nuclear transport factor 2 family protein n=1 Tax=Streptomyces sp. NPDC127117 TaxID=3345368 RepID=UPI00362B4E1E